MLTVSKRRLPGVYFQTVSPVAEQGLPRMDIAGFVGFASSGPINIPVPIEDIGHFRDIFGPDLELAWDQTSDRAETSFLGNAVESFFHNGGKKCWVVRVAKNSAQTHRYPLPTIIGADEGMPAHVRARCPGSWSDTLRVSTRLNSEIIVADHLLDKGENQLVFDPESGAYEITIPARPDQINRGDLLNLRFRDNNGHQDKKRFNLYLTASSVKVLSSGSIKVKGAAGHWFGRLDSSSLKERIGIVEKATIIDAVHQGSDDNFNVPAESVFDVEINNTTKTTSPWIRVFVPAEGSSDTYEVEFRYDKRKDFIKFIDRLEPKSGQILHLVVRHGELEENRKQDLWLIVDEKSSDTSRAPWPRWYVEKVEREDLKLWTRVVARNALWPVRGQDVETTAEVEEATVTVERLRFRLYSWDNQRLLNSIDDLGFGDVPQNFTSLDESLTSNAEVNKNEAGITSRFWARLPVDEVLFKENDRLPEEAGALIRDAVEPRFAFAGPENPSSLYIPFGMPRRLDPAFAHGCLSLTGTALERDGLEDFNAEVFLDSNFDNTPLFSCTARANDLKYIKGISLQGLFSLFHIEEVSLIAIPDISHRGWHREAPDLVGVVTSPINFAMHGSAIESTVEFTWEMPDTIDTDRLQKNGIYFELEESLDTSFEKAVQVYRGEQTTSTVSGDESKSVTRFYRVRAFVDNIAGPWSKTISRVSHFSFFSDSDNPLKAIELRLEVEREGEESGPTEAIVQPGQNLDDGIVTQAFEDSIGLGENDLEGAEASVEGNQIFVLRWDKLDNTEFTYTIQEASDPAFYTAKTVLKGSKESNYPLTRSHSHHTYFRIRAEGPAPDFEQGPWSNTVLFQARSQHQWVMFTRPEFDSDLTHSLPLRTVHANLLRFCGARGDVVTTLSLPHHYREEQILTHLDLLSPMNSDASILQADEAQALSYGSLYHPWITDRIDGNAEEDARFYPPDGTMCGVIAARSISDGAWIAPANVPFKSVLALNPSISREGWQILHEHQVNLLRSDPRGLMALSADTLSVNQDLRPLNVRRLMILIKRLALREGDAFVFRSNDSELHEMVRRRFEELFNRLYQLGAFAGASASEAFQVETGPSVNPPQSVALGRLVVELRVAPSKPLSFITVRLVQRDRSGISVSEG